MSLIVLTRSPEKKIFSIEAFKKWIKKLTGRVRGPSAVTSSLLAGLEELNVGYKLNPMIGEIEPNDIVWTHDSKEALQFALGLKSRKLIRALAVGPALGMPFRETMAMIKHPMIDVICQPSQWGYDFCTNEYPELSDKIKIWPAGVNLPDLSPRPKNNEIMIYVKMPSDTSLLPFIENVLYKMGISYTIVQYGAHSQDDYFHALNRVKGGIFLSNSESQGIALQEAWAHDVPTLVWNRGYMEHAGYKWRDAKISAPYLNEMSGKFFTGTADFEAEFDVFWKTIDNYHPRQYVEANLSNRICAQKFLAIINEYDS